MKEFDLPGARQRLRETFQRGGTRAAVAYLNSLTDRRFTSLYRFASDQLRSVTFFDREDPAQSQCETIPVMASYCVFVRDSSSLFRVDDSLGERHLDGHPKQRQVRSYCGVPLRDREGRMFGTVCHFDFEPGRVSDQDVDLMEYLASLLQPTLVAENSA